MSNALLHSVLGLINKLVMVVAIATLTACGGGSSSDPAPSAQASAEALRANRITGPGLIADQPAVVNTTVAGTQTLSAMGARSDGGYAVAWVSQGDASAAPALYLQHYDAAGAMVGPETLVQIDIASLHQPAIAVMSDGGVLVAYSLSSPVSTTEPWIVRSTLYTRRFDASGAAAGGETEVHSFVQNLLFAQIIYSFTDLAIVTWPDGRYLVGWAYVESSYLGSIPTFSFRLFDALGAPLGDAFGAIRGEVGTSFKLTAIPDGGFVIATFHRLMGQQYVIFGVHSSTGESASIGTYLDPVLGLPASQTVLLPLVDGRLALWSSNQGGPYLQMFDRAGTAVGSPTPGSSLPSFASALSDGGYATFTRAGSIEPFAVQRFSSAGSPLGDSFQVQVEPAAIGTLPMMTSPLDGGLVLGWTGTSTAGGLDVYAQHFEEAQTKQARMRDCRTQAQGLQGAERRQFMRQCMNR